MHHFLYNMVSNTPAPAGAGDTDSWFRHYKLESGGETFVPSKEEYEALEGDLLWFAMDAVIIGYAPILRQLEDGFNNKWELWFDSTQYVPTPQPFAQVDSWATTVPEAQAKGWLKCIEEG